jgi:phosphatidate cytidylyltransferase
LKQRIITGFIGGALFIGFLWIGGLWFAALISLLAFVAYYELIKMSSIKLFSIPSVAGFVYLGAILLASLSHQYKGSLFQLDYFQVMLSFVFLLLLLTILSKNQFMVEQAGVLFIGVFYIGFGFLTFIEARLDHGLALVLFSLIVIWSTDSGAYFTGRKLGKHKLWPSISPNKTIEGAIGGVVFAILAAVIFQLISTSFENWGYVLMLALIISIGGQIGDLVESGIKRHYQVKDSGALLPGHGGVLDRFDSLLFVFPILFLFQLI